MSPKNHNFNQMLVAILTLNFANVQIIHTDHSKHRQYDPQTQFGFTNFTDIIIIWSHF